MNELTVVAKRQSLLQHLVPDESRAGVGHRIIAVVRVASIETPEALLDVIGDVGFSAPLVPVGAQDAAAVEIVQQNELLHQSVMIGRNLASEMYQGRIAVALGKIAKDLVVRPILFDDVEHVFEG